MGYELKDLKELEAHIEELRKELRPLTSKVGDLEWKIGNLNEIRAGLLNQEIRKQGIVGKYFKRIDENYEWYVNLNKAKHSEDIIYGTKITIQRDGNFCSYDSNYGFSSRDFLKFVGYGPYYKPSSEEEFKQAKQKACAYMGVDILINQIEKYGKD